MANTAYTYYDKKEELLEKEASTLTSYMRDFAKMLKLNAKTAKLGRSPVYNLGGSLRRSDKIGGAISEATRLMESAALNSKSISKSYNFTNKAENPLRMYSSAKKYVDNIPALIREDLKNNILVSASRHDNKNIHNFVGNLAKNPKLLDNHVDKLLEDIAAGKNLSIHIPNAGGNGRHVQMTIDAPFLSHNGSAVLNTKDVMSIDGINSYRKAMDKLKDYEVVAGKKFGAQFSDKLKMREPITIADLNTVDKLEAYLNNPFVSGAYKPNNKLRTRITTDILQAAKQSRRPADKVFKDKIIEIAADPSKAAYLDMLKLQRYGSEDLQKVIEAAKIPSGKYSAEHGRLLFDAVGAIGAAAAVGTIGYGMSNKKTKQQLMQEVRQKYLTQTA